jgi:hypothetical protein
MPTELCQLLKAVKLGEHFYEQNWVKVLENNIQIPLNKGLFYVSPVPSSLSKQKLERRMFMKLHVTSAQGLIL